MRYVGNTALSPQIQERIQNTFEQTIGLAEEGNRQEALLGCDFILRLDPLFEPARRLQERLNEGEGPVEVTNLMRGEAPVPAEGPAPVAESIVPEASIDIGELIADAPDETAVVGDIPVEVVPPDPEMPLVEAPIELTDDEDPPIALTPAEELPVDLEPIVEAIEVDEEPIVADLSTRMAMLLEQRNYQDLMALAMENQERISSDKDLQQMISVANERLEAEPYVRNFLESAQVAKEKGDFESSRSHLEKARELDPSHPDLSRLEADLAAASRVEPPAAFEPPPMVEVPLVDTPPMTEPVAGGEIEDEVDEFFASVESAAPEAILESPSAPETEPEIRIQEPKPVPTLDAEPAARLDNESEQRIDDLLKEGQESFENGQYQTAIDAWSRVFLIDIDHAEASRRIELARKLKAEVERQTEETFHEGITRLESGDEEKAKAAFNKVLEMQPNHMGARDFLDKIESGDLSASPPPPPELSPLEAVAPAGVEPDDSEFAEFDELTPTTAPAPSALGDRAMAGLDPASAPAPRRRSFALIGSAVLILVLAVGWFVYSDWSRFFPASGPDESATAQRPQADPIERSRELHEAGNTAMAINVLRRLPPGDDQYAEAQALIASWEASDQPQATTSDEPSEELLMKREELVAQAEQAMARGRNLSALDHLEQAATILQLDEEQEALRNQVTVALEFLREERDLFDQGDWEYALPNLWRMHDNNPENPDVLELMVASYYNLGLRDLQRGDAKSALEKFEEAQELVDGDAELDKLAQFAAAYSQRSSDMLYRIFVKYQRFR